MPLNFVEMVNRARENANRNTLSLEQMEAELRRLRGVRDDAERDDAVSGPPQGGVRVVGDPEIVDSLGRRCHYLGPALLVIHDDRGMVRALEFVGVGNNDDYINEVWHLNIKTGTYKYKDLTDLESPGIQLSPDLDPKFEAGEPTWSSEKDSGEVPPKEFMAQFKPHSETFFVDSRRGRFVRGPEYGLLRAALQNPKRLVQSLVASSVEADVWMKNAANLANDTTRDPCSRPCRRMQAVQVAQLAFGLASCRVNWIVWIEQYSNRSHRTISQHSQWQDSQIMQSIGFCCSVVISDWSWEWTWSAKGADIWSTCRQKGRPQGLWTSKRCSGWNQW